MLTCIFPQKMNPNLGSQLSALAICIVVFYVKISQNWQNYKDRKYSAIYRLNRKIFAIRSLYMDIISYLVMLWRAHKVR